MNLQELAGGPAIMLDEEFARAQIAGRAVLITGAGGSIGSALARTVARFAPRRLVLLDSSEHGLYEVERQLRGSGAVEVVLGSVADKSLMDEVFGRWNPEVVFHAAAFKQVPLLEENPFAAMANNAVATQDLLSTASRAGVDRFVLVSTDKAVEPVSVMGASKRIAELALLAMPDGGMKVCAVRLGNVLGSRGSVVPLFEAQMRRGEALTVTHPEARRYFMTVESAVAALIGALGAEGRIVVPELGEQVRVRDVAAALLKGEGGGAGIVFITLRPGDKMEEALLSGREEWGVACGVLRGVRSPAVAAAVVAGAMEEMRVAVGERDRARLFAVVRRLVPEYAASGQLAAAVRA